MVSEKGGEANFSPTKSHSYLDCSGGHAHEEVCSNPILGETTTQLSLRKSVIVGGHVATCDLIEVDEKSFLTMAH